MVVYLANLLHLGALPIIAARTERLIHRNGAECPCHSVACAASVERRQTVGDLNGPPLAIEIGDVGRQPPARAVGSKHP
jgi:hypothetical protein